MEERLQGFISRLIDQPEEILAMLSHAQYTTWDSFMMMDIDKIPGLTYPWRRGPVHISTRFRSTLTQIKELMNAEYESGNEQADDPD